MSKIGKKAITITSAKVQIQGNLITISGPKGSFKHELPQGLSASLDGKNFFVTSEKKDRKDRVVWGTHRALLANKIKGVETGFEQKITIVGLGFKAQIAGQKLTLTLGYTHKIDYTMPKEVSIEIDKTGQLLTLRSNDKFMLGNVCDAIRSFRPPEPYKGTGVIREGEVIVRKAGKTKATASA
jgi:large subunit ribosomal protein L6